VLDIDSLISIDMMGGFMIGEKLFQIGSLTIYTYGFFVMLAVLSTSLMIYLLAQKANLQKTVIFDLVIYTLLFGIIGARITFYILYPDQFSSFWEIFKIWQGGLVSWGGFILGIAAAITVLKIYKENILKWLDILAISSLLGLAVGRLGSFLSGELAGLPYKGYFSISGVHPVTLYESLILLFIFFIWLILYLKYYKTMTPGIYILGVVGTYSLSRFIIDFFRQESDVLASFSLGQLFSIVVLALSIVIFVIYIISKKKGPENVVS